MINGRDIRAAFAAGVLLLALPGIAGAGVVLEWNQIALAASVTAGQGPNPQTRTMAIVHVTIHDSLNAIVRRYRLYSSPPAVPPGASADAAVIAAAHTVLRHLFSAQSTTLDGHRQASLAAHGLTEADPGIPVGESVAAAILAMRASDGAAQATFPYSAPGAGLPGVWVPIGLAAPVLPGWGSVTPWVLTRADQFSPGQPHDLRHPRYAADLNEVKEIGSRFSTVRTAEQSEIARFWLATPPSIWNGIARRMIEAHALDDPDAARVLAHLYLAATDAGIACWKAKYEINYWRPRTAIRGAELDGNSGTEADLTWEPFLTTPQHPEFPSGHSTNSGAMATVLMLTFGDKPGVPILGISPANPTFTRTWSRFSEALAEVIDARIYSGFHFRLAMESGARLGSRIATYVVARTFGRRRL